MLNLLVAVLREEDKSEAIMERWRSAGVKGITMLASEGLSDLHDRIGRDDVPLMPSLRSLFETGEISHRTIFSLIDDDETLERAIAGSIEVVRDFDLPHTGILFVVPVARAWGLMRHPSEAER